jgi:hypothetical protein
LTTTLVEPLESVPIYIDARDAGNRPIGSGVEAIWESSDESVARVSHGILTGVSPGDATIRASTGGLTGSTVVHVGWRPDTRLSIGSSRMLLDVGVRAGLFPTLTRSTGLTQLSGRDVDWTSSNPAIAHVDDYGMLWTFAAGTTTLVAHLHSLVDSAVVEVGGLVPGFGYFYSGDAFVNPFDYLDETFWTPARGKGFSTSGIAGATWVPYTGMPDFGWVGPNTPLRDAVLHAVSLDSLPCTAYAQTEIGWQFVAPGSPLVECRDAPPPPQQQQQSIRMELVAFRPGEFIGTLATIRPGAPAFSTTAGGITQTSATTNSRSYAMPGVPSDSIFWFVTPGGSQVSSCRIAPSDGSLAQATVRVICGLSPFAQGEPPFYAAGFGVDARHGTAPIGFAEISNTGVVTRKVVNGLDISITGSGARSTDIVVSGIGLAAFERLPAVLLTPISLEPRTCSITEPLRATPTMVKLTVICSGVVSGFTLGVIY